MEEELRLNQRGNIIFSIVALVAAFAVVVGFNQQPAFADSFYHYNAAEQLAGGNGLVDQYVWLYFTLPETIPAPSYTYWMPGTSLVAALGMLIFGSSYAAAQVGFALCLWGAAFVGYWLGWKLGKTSRHAWMVGLLTIFSGFYLRVWGQTDTFAPYALVGSLSLAFVGLGITAEKQQWRWWLLAGIFAGLGHLVRNDGLLLLLVGWLALLWPSGNHIPWKQRLIWLMIFTTAYALTMLPWFLRNQNVIGAVLPAGGTQAIWYSEYNDLFGYPPDASPQILFADGAERFIESRVWALFSANGALVNFVALEGVIVLTPFILIALWRRRYDPFLRAVIWFTLGIYAAFSLVFPFPGVRGGLFHAAAALVPWMMALGLVGLDDAIEWIARRRRTWKPAPAKRVFSGGIFALIVLLSLALAIGGRTEREVLPEMMLLADLLPADARVMLNDPARLYYFTGLQGVQLPNEAPEVALEIAERYDVDYLFLETGGITTPMQFDTPPDFLIPIDTNLAGVQLYAFERD